MDFKTNETFNKYINNFLKLELNDKKDYTINEFKKLSALLIQYLSNRQIDCPLIINKKLGDINNGNESEEDFVEATYVYLKIIEELIAECLERND